MRNLCFLLFAIFSTFAQDKKLEVKINSITTEDVNSSNRVFNINYQIENKTNDTISFFLMPNALIANAASSSTLYTVYKIYQNGKFEDMDGPFFEYETANELEYATLEDRNTEYAKKLLKRIQMVQSITTSKYYKEYKDNGGNSNDYKWILNRGKLLKNIVQINPNQTKEFTIKTLWNKNRFIKNDDLEYYLNENDIFEIELILDLKTDIFKDQLSEEDFKMIKENPNFIKGEFISNKFKLDFKD